MALFAQCAAQEIFRLGRHIQESAKYVGYRTYLRAENLHTTISSPANCFSPLAIGGYLPPPVKLIFRGFFLRASGLLRCAQDFKIFMRIKNKQEN